MLAGHETTSVALAWTLYELAKNPLIQEKVRAEINTVISEGNELTWDTVEEFEYLENVVKESLRLHPPAYLTSRTPISDEIIGGYLIPKGWIFYCPSIHCSVVVDIGRIPMNFILKDSTRKVLDF